MTHIVAGKGTEQTPKRLRPAPRNPGVAGGKGPGVSPPALQRVPEQVLDLAVQAAQIVLGPALQRVVQRGVEAEQKGLARHYWYRVPALITGWVPRSAQSTTSRLLTIEARRSPSSSRIAFSESN